jgi:hypothetical protein
MAAQNADNFERARFYYEGRYSEYLKVAHIAEMFHPPLAMAGAGIYKTPTSLLG